jgi:enoyl-[acyl-carrier protein] reductase I
MNLLKGKNVLIVGVANKHSIAAGIAQSMSENGANIALTYQNERLKDNVTKLGKEWDIDTFLPCDVSSDEEIKKTFIDLGIKMVSFRFSNSCRWFRTS